MCQNNFKIPIINPHIFEYVKIRIDGDETQKQYLKNYYIFLKIQ